MANKDQVRISPKSGEIVYPKTMPNEELKETLGFLVGDCTRTRVKKKRFLQSRIFGESELIAKVHKTLQLNREGIKLKKLYIKWEALTIAPQDNAYQLWFPVTLRHGLLTMALKDSRGYKLWKDIQTYDTALHICTYRCLNDVDRIQYTANELDNHRRMAEQNFIAQIEHPLFQEGFDYMNTITKKISEIERAPGAYLLEQISDIFSLYGDTDTIRKATKATIKIWGAQMMTNVGTYRHIWLIKKFRSVIVSYYQTPTGLDGMVIEKEPYAKYISLWNAIIDDTNRTNNAAREISDLQNGMISILNDDKPSRKRGIASIPHISETEIYLGESVFYSDAVIPLVLCTAALFTYLDKVDDGLVIEGTETLKAASFASPGQDPNADLVSYTVFIVHHMNISLSGKLVGGNGVPVVTDWAPESVKHYTGKDLMETTGNLIRAWKTEGSADGERWIRTLRAITLISDGNPEPKVEDYDEIDKLINMFKDMSTTAAPE
jgi:hypothetical protein